MVCSATIHCVEMLSEGMRKSHNYITSSREDDGSGSDDIMLEPDDDNEMLHSADYHQQILFCRSFDSPTGRSMQRPKVGGVPHFDHAAVFTL